MTVDEMTDGWCIKAVGFVLAELTIPAHLRDDARSAGNVAVFALRERLRKRHQDQPAFGQHLSKSRLEQTIRRDIIAAMGAEAKHAHESDTAEWTPAAGAEYVHSDEREKLLAAVEQLPEDHRLLLNMKFHQGMTLAAIARTLGESKSGVHARLQRALASLKRSMQKGACQ